MTPELKEEERKELAAARRRYLRRGGKITKLPAFGAPGKEAIKWNGREVEQLQAITRARNAARKKAIAATAKPAATSKAKKQRNQQELRKDWTELDDQK